jgi:hypothetical protein
MVVVDSTVLVYQNRQFWFSRSSRKRFRISLMRCISISFGVCYWKPFWYSTSILTLPFS